MRDNGAHYFNCDFQVHTPRDAQWKGNTPIFDDDRKAYADKFIKACHKKGLNAVAITDHHDMVFVKYIRDAAKNEVDDNGDPVPEDEKIIVFPGMELTLAVPCQAILIFDADLPEHLFDIIYAALAISISDPSEGKTAPTERLPHINKVDDICEALNKQKAIKGRYILLPNVTNEGKFSLLRSGMAPKYKEMSCVGAYIDGSYSKLKPKIVAITSGENKDWGEKKVAIFQTSDNRKESFEDLGKNSSYVKWSEPTAEALRQACLADKTRITHEEPFLPLTNITRVRVSNSKFMGPVDIDLNPQYTTFIGGRGTGKSTLLEYVRWAVCDHNLQSIDEDSPEYKKRTKKLIENTLIPFEGVIEIFISINGVDYVVKRSSESSEVFLKAKDEDYNEIKPDEIRSLIPIQAYSQKQMSDVGIRIDELKRFVYSPIIENLNKIDDRFETLSNKIRKQYAEVRQKRTVEKEIFKQETLSKSLSDQAKEIKKSLKGLSEADQKIINKNSIYQDVDSAIGAWEEEITITSDLFNDFSDGITSFPSDLPENIGELAVADRKHVKELRRKLLAKYKTIKKYIDRIKIEIESLDKEGSEIAQQFEEWSEKFEGFEEEYTQAKEKSSAHQSKLLRLQELESRSKDIRADLAKLKTELSTLGKPLDDYNGLLEEWVSLHEEQTLMIEGVCKDLSEYSKSEIKADLLIGHGFSQIAVSLEQAIKGSGIRSAKGKIEKMREYIINEISPLRAWFLIVKELEGIALFDYENDDKKDLPETNILQEIGFTASDIHSLSSVFNLDIWLDLSLIRLEDHPQFQYHKGDGEYIPFQDASAGQQATSLLKALLNQPGPPLIIDQPEDDLDNKIILDVVEQIWEAKSKRQIIFTSHNANLVVNGDADLVVCCDYATDASQSRGKIDTVGAIDIPETKNSIKRVMEGGDKAFELRSQKYGF